MTTMGYSGRVSINKHVSFWRIIDGDGVFLLESSGFLKIHWQKIILCRFEKIFLIFLDRKFQKSLIKNSYFRIKTSKMVVKFPENSSDTILKFSGIVFGKVSIDFYFCLTFFLKTNLSVGLLQHFRKSMEIRSFLESLSIRVNGTTPSDQMSTRAICFFLCTECS